MPYTSLKQCLIDLKQTGQLRVISIPINPKLEMAEIQRRVYRNQGPALLFTNLVGCKFPAVANLFGTPQRARYILRHGLKTIELLIRLKVSPEEVITRPTQLIKLLPGLYHLFPRYLQDGPLLTHSCRLQDLPQQISWPHDGGAFITLPLVYSEDPDEPGWRRSNLGMYRIQLSGGNYIPNQEVGVHYQIHRGIGVHHAKALEKNVPFRINICVGGPPALTMSAVMPLPEGIPEVAFAGILGARRINLIEHPPYPPLLGDADFCLCGTILPDRLKPEGPFGDHLGYYSLTHDYPVLQVERIYHRPGAIWPFTSVGRPPQEDSTFAHLIHEWTRPLLKTVIPGVHEVNAVDAAGVHPLLLVLGSERYTPYLKRNRPQELLTCANAVLGHGQLSLAKFLWICAREDDPTLTTRDVKRFLLHALERVDWRRDLHFQTETTVDTLDYTGRALNHGSKVVIAATGPSKRKLSTVLPSQLRLPPAFKDLTVCAPGILAVSGPSNQRQNREIPDPNITDLIKQLNGLDDYPLLIIADDARPLARDFNYLLWVTFTRADPATDLHGPNETTINKHWGCQCPLVIDARSKPHHAPVLQQDPEISARVDALAAPGGPLHGLY